MYPYSVEPDMDYLWWFMGLFGTPLLRGIAVHHHHRHPVRQAAFQDGRIVISSFRERGGLTLLIIHQQAVKRIEGVEEKMWIDLRLIKR